MHVMLKINGWPFFTYVNGHGALFHGSYDHAYEVHGHLHDHGFGLRHGYDGVHDHGRGYGGGDDDVPYHRVDGHAHAHGYAHDCACDYVFFC